LIKNIIHMVLAIRQDQLEMYIQTMEEMQRSRLGYSSNHIYDLI
jgi:hypothetical protein